MYKGKTPCQGCGKSGDIEHRRTKDSLCIECRKSLKRGQAIDAESRVLKYTYISQWHHALTNYKDDDRVLNESLREFIKSIDNPKAERENIEIGLVGQHYDNSYKATIPTVFIEPIKKLFYTLEGLMKELKDEKRDLFKQAKEEAQAQKDLIFREGVKYGKSLLIAMNNGDISMTDFENEQKGYEQK